MEGRFQPGEHLQVRRPMGYHHHGIYVSDDRVIQFGSGVTLLSKSGTAIDAVSLHDFEKGGRAEVVRHGYESLLDCGYHPAADEPWKIIARAEFLLKLQPKLAYNLIGHNCEIIANMCASGGWTESYQVRRWFGRKAMAGMVLYWLAGRSRAGRALPSWAVFAAVVVWVGGGFAAIATYNHQIKRFWDEIKEDWFAHERVLDEDPRNGLSG